MDIQEKILLVQLLLKDIRLNWGWEKRDRAAKAKELCEEINQKLNSLSFHNLAKTCEEYICCEEDGCNDGRFFRAEFPDGYEGMDHLHGLTHTFADKSYNFKITAEEYLTYPEYLFDDWYKEDM